MLFSQSLNLLVCVPFCAMCVCVFVCSCSKVLLFVVKEAKHADHKGILGWVFLVRWRVKLSQITCSVEGGEKRFTMVNKKGISVLARTPFCFLFFWSFFFVAHVGAGFGTGTTGTTTATTTTTRTTRTTTTKAIATAIATARGAKDSASLLADASAKIEQS